MSCEKEIFEDIIKFIGLKKEHYPYCRNGPDLISQVSKSREQSAIRRERKTKEIPACEVRSLQIHKFAVGVLCCLQ